MIDKIIVNMELPAIQETIFDVRGQKIMLDRDLAKLYEVPTKSLNLAVKRNIERFPLDFMFRLTKEEFVGLRFQIETSNRGGDRYLPYAFTELGIAMLSSVLNNSRAVQMNILIMRAFVFLRQNVLTYKELIEELDLIRGTVNNHSEQLNLLYEAIENFLDTKAEQKNWEERDRIGFQR